MADRETLEKLRGNGPVQLQDAQVETRNLRDASVTEAKLAFGVATQAELDAHLNDTTDAHDASAISILDTAADFTATDVEGALAELQSDNEAHVAAADPHAGYRLESADHSHQSTGLQAGQLDHGLALTGLGDDDHPQYALDTDLNNHLNDTVDAHDASAISYAGGTGMSATDVEAAIDELATEKSDTTHAHTGAMVQKNASTTTASITATGDSQATLNLASATGISEVWFEFLVRIDSGTNTQIIFEAEIHDPSHNILEAIEFKAPALGAGTEYKTSAVVFARDTTPGAGDYHINVTTISVTGGSAIVQGRRLVGVAS